MFLSFFFFGAKSDNVLCLSTGDPYLNNALNGLVEIFAYFSMIFAVCIGRVPLLSAGFIFAGIFCIASMLCDIFSFDDGGKFRKCEHLVKPNCFFCLMLALLMKL